MFVTYNRMELSRELHWLEDRMPGLMKGSGRCLDAFRSESSRLLECAGPDDYSWLEDQLLQLVQRHGAQPSMRMS